MLDRFRLPIIVVSTVLFLYGAWTFWGGKLAVDTERRTRKPKLVTLDDLLVDPPKRGGGWYTITDGVASLPRGYLREYEGDGAPVANAPFFLFAPILTKRDGKIPETAYRLETEVVKTSVVVCLQKKQYKDLYKTWSKMEGSDDRTVDTWLLQNKDSMAVRPPFTGVLVPARYDTLTRLGAEHVNAEFPINGWIMLEGKLPEIAENPQVAIGLALMMGIPTFWIFALLITGKLAPPDEDTLPIEKSTKSVAETPSSNPGFSAMPSAMPVPDEPDTKKPRR